jgi:hypothetical protein
VVLFFVRIGSYWAFDHSTKELHHGKESEEGKKENEEEVNFELRCVGVATLTVTSRFGGWTVQPPFACTYASRTVKFAFA